MTRIGFLDFSYRPLQNQEGKHFGQEILRQINSCSYFLFKSISLLISSVSISFRQRKVLLNDKLSQLSKSHYRYDRRIHKAVIAIEDKRFLFHRGHDVRAITRAILNNINTNRVQGASTIEQQLVRIILEENAVTLKRKILEILFSTQLHDKLSKLQIIDIYLDNYIFSGSVIGIREFCTKEGYNLLTLSEKDICEIVARIKYPIISKRNYLNYLRRVRTIEKLIDSM